MVTLIILITICPQEKLVNRENGGAVLESLKRLRTLQKADGSWEDKSKSYPRGITSLALLAYLGADFTPDSPTFGEVVSRGLGYLIRSQGQDGNFAGPKDMKYMYEHAVATIALAEAYGRTRAEKYQAPLKKAVEFLVAAQNPGKGWRYSAKCIDNDSSVTGWVLLALRSAQLSGIEVPKQVIDDGRKWLEQMIEEKGKMGYVVRGQGHLWVSRRIFEEHETLTALGMIAREDFSATDRVLKVPPAEGKTQVDYLYWMFGAAAVRKTAGWPEWKSKLKPLLLKLRSENGDFPADDEHSTYELGEIYRIAIGTLALEVCAEYPEHFLLRAN